MVRILVAENDPNTRKLLCTILKMNGYEPYPACSSEEALKGIAEHHVDLLICDVMMSHTGDLRLHAIIRNEDSMLPILLMTAGTIPESMQNIFPVDTQEYIAKPPDREELLRKVAALLRRAKIRAERKILIDDVCLDYDTHSVSRGFQTQVLPPKEFSLLYRLLAYPGRTFTGLELLDGIRVPDKSCDDPNTIDRSIARLQNRFLGWPEFEIQVLRGLGYRAVIH